MYRTSVTGIIYHADDVTSLRTAYRATNKGNEAEKSPWTIIAYGLDGYTAMLFASAIHEVER